MRGQGALVVFSTLLELTFNASLQQLRPALIHCSYFARGTLGGRGGCHDAASDAQPIEQVVVTGSYIKGAVEDAALPVTVIDRDEIERRGGPAILDVIRSLSASQGTVGESNPGGVLFGTGSVGVNLRGFDSGRTLVLFNGRRLPVSPVALLGVDVNLLPLGAVERIEVLKDGAAATYGSDAIAGVVNFISRRGFEGLSLEGSYTSFEDSDGDYSTNLLWGHKTDGIRRLALRGLSTSLRAARGRS